MKGYDKKRAAGIRAARRLGIRVEIYQIQRPRAVVVELPANQHLSRVIGEVDFDANPNAITEAVEALAQVPA